MGEKGSAAELYKRVLLKNTHLAARKREMARIEQLAAQAEEERAKGEVYVLRLADDVKGGLGVIVVSEASQEKENAPPPVREQKTSTEDEKMEVDAPECGDIELLPDIPDMEFEDEHGRPFVS